MLPSHQERDFHQKMQKFLPYGLQPDTICFDLTGTDLPLNELAISIVWPHEICSALWAAGPKQRNVSLLGPCGEKGIAEWWANALRLPEYQCHPCALNRDDLKRMIAWVTHHDGCEVYRDCEYEVWSVHTAHCTVGSIFDDDFELGQSS